MKNLYRRVIAPFIMLFGIVIIIITIASSLSTLDFTQSFNFTALLVSLLMQFLAFFAAVLSWQKLIEPLGIHIDYSASMAQNGQMLLGKYIPGSVVGVVSRGYSLSLTTTPLIAWRSSIIDQATYYVAAGFIAMYFLFPSSITLIFSAIAVCLIYVITTLNLGDKTILKQFQISFSYSWLQWIFGMLGFFLVFYSFSANGDFSSYVRIACLYCLAVVAGIVLPFLPAGIGIREGILVWGMSDLVDTEIAMLIAGVSRLILVFRDLLVGGFIFARKRDR